MRHLILLLLPGPALADAIQVPSGQPVELVEKIVETDGLPGLTWRYRFLAPQISRDGGAVSVDVALADIDAICTDFIAFEAAAADPPPAQIIITLMDQIVAFGDTAPHATQFFEAYRIEGETCVWEGF